MRNDKPYWFFAILQAVSRVVPAGVPGGGYFHGSSGVGPPPEDGPLPIGSVWAET